MGRENQVGAKMEREQKEGREGMRGKVEKACEQWRKGGHKLGKVRVRGFV